MGTLRTYDIEKKRKELSNWDIVDKEKQSLSEYIDYFLAGKHRINSQGRNKTIGKNPNANLISRIDGLKRILERLCNKEEIYYLDHTKIIRFRDDLVAGKIKKGIWKGKKNCKKEWVETGKYTPKGIAKKMLYLKNYLEFRFRPDERFALDINPPEEELIKVKKIRYFAKHLNADIKDIKKEWRLDKDIVEELLLKANTEWKIDFLMIQKAIGRRIGEILQMQIKDFELPKNKEDGVYFSVPAMNSRTKEVERVPVFYNDSRDYIVKTITKKLARGMNKNNLIIGVPETTIKQWLRREGQRIIKKNIRSKDFRDYAATRIVQDKKITSRFKLCEYFSWTYSSPMPDKYLNRGDIDWSKEMTESKESDLTETNKELIKIKEERTIERERQRQLEKIRREELEVLKIENNKAYRVVEKLLSEFDIIKQQMKSKKK